MVFLSVSVQIAAYSTYADCERRQLKTTEELLIELLFADDCALLTHSETTLQHIINCLSSATKAFGLTISLKKTEVIYQPPPRGSHIPPEICIDGTTLNAVDHFTYLGSVISHMMQQ